jgi:hypothetical protein
MRYLAALAAIMVVAVPASGCGGSRHEQTESERVAMENEYGKVVLSIGNATMGSRPADPKFLERFTRQYVAVTRKYAGQIGDDAARQRLTDEVSQVQPWCPTCAQILTDAAAQY